MSIYSDPQEAKYITADCGHECYPGEKMYWFNGKWLCPDCMLEKFDDLTLDEKAQMFDCEIRTVGVQ